MRLRYTDAEGRLTEILLGESEIIVGRSPEADIVLPGHHVSRRHAAIRLWQGDYMIKDLGSENGTLVNGQRVPVAIIKSGDTIQIGPYVLEVQEREEIKAPDTVIRQIHSEMKRGKGYSTIMREIVDEAEGGLKKD